MIEQHEEERRRLSRELHDETAQVFSAVKIELGVLRDNVPADQTARLDQVLGLIDTGIRSIRNVTNDLRPSLLDDLGLLPALRSLVGEFGERSGIRVGLAAPAALPPLSEEAELALFRALQEALSNVLRHAEARSVDVGISVRRDGVLLEVRDDGRGLAAGFPPEGLERGGHMGLAGMRERIGALGGTVRLHGEPGAGAMLEVLVPANGVSPGERDPDPRAGRRRSRDRAHRDPPRAGERARLHRRRRGLHRRRGAGAGRRAPPRRRRCSTSPCPATPASGSPPSCGSARPRPTSSS